MEEIIKIQNENFNKEGEYMKDFENKQLPTSIHYHIFESEGEKTLHGESVNVNNIKKGDFIVMYQQPCLVSVINESKKGVWIIGKCIYNLLECDIVFKHNDHAEKLSYTLSKGKVLSINNGYMTVEILNENEKTEIVIELPDVKALEKIHNDLNRRYTNQEEIYVEVLSIYGSNVLSRII